MNLTTLRQRSELTQLKKEIAEQNKELKLAQYHLQKVDKVMDTKDKEVRELEQKLRKEAEDTDQD